MSHFLIGERGECYIVEEVIEVDELDKGNLSAALGKQDKELKAELSYATLGFLSNQIKSNIVPNNKPSIEPNIELNIEPNIEPNILTPLNLLTAAVCVALCNFFIMFKYSPCFETKS